MKKIRTLVVDDEPLARERVMGFLSNEPDIEIVGDDLHPLGKVKDFAPYVSKIAASGAQAVITGNWGNDLALLIKASKDAGLKVDYYTYYGGIVGTPPAIGESGVGHVKQVSFWAPNVGTPHAAKMTAAYRERFKGANDDYWFNGPMVVLELVAQAMEQAKSAEPLAVANPYFAPGLVHELRVDLAIARQDTGVEQVGGRQHATGADVDPAPIVDGDRLECPEVTAVVEREHCHAAGGRANRE